VTIVLAGDPGQLPPVKGKILWNPAAGNVGARKHDFAEFGLYQYFENVVKLVRNVRINPDDPDAVTFNDFQMRLWEMHNGREDNDTVQKTCSRHSMPVKESGINVRGLTTLTPHTYFVLTRRSRLIIASSLRSWELLLHTYELSIHVRVPLLARILQKDWLPQSI
jgi:hypothetical protein